MKKREYYRLSIEPVPCAVEQGFMTGSISLSPIRIGEVTVESSAADSRLADAGQDFKPFSFD